MPRPAGYAKFPNIVSISLSDEQVGAIRMLQAEAGLGASFSSIVRQLLEAGLERRAESA